MSIWPSLLQRLVVRTLVASCASREIKTMDSLFQLMEVETGFLKSGFQAGSGPMVDDEIRHALNRRMNL
ncbi:hypothetical protein N0V85_003850 [Neurospora sp. IMI 360204]|nr:hypothetical protein N0V85_003850 [Neurospora sp. IMI 360204]